MSIVCLLKALNRYIRLNETRCSVDYAQPCVFQILDKNLHDMAYFRGYWLFPGWFQVISVVSWFVSDSSCMFSGAFRRFQVVLGRSRSSLVLVST